MVIFQEGFFRVGVILGEHFPGRNCSGGNFLGGSFPSTTSSCCFCFAYGNEEKPILCRILLIHFALPFLFPLKTSENPRFSNTVWNKISSFDRAYGQMSYYSCFSME